MTLAERLAAFTAGLRFEALPADVLASARLRTLDVIGLALAASTFDFAAPVIAAVEAGSGPCTIIGTRRTAGPAAAALANGTLAHGLDFDDTHAASDHARLRGRRPDCARGRGERRHLRA